MAPDDTRPPIDLGEDDAAFAQRRAVEERQQIAKSSCMVRSVHEELLEAYEDRAAAGADEPAALDAMLHIIDVESRRAERRR
jgi:hypothetical protein